MQPHESLPIGKIVEIKSNGFAIVKLNADNPDAAQLLHEALERRYGQEHDPETGTTENSRQGNPLDG